MHIYMRVMYAERFFILMTNIVSVSFSLYPSIYLAVSDCVRVCVYVRECLQKPSEHKPRFPYMLMFSTTRGEIPEQEDEWIRGIWHIPRHESRLRRRRRANRVHHYAQRRPMTAAATKQ